MATNTPGTPNSANDSQELTLQAALQEYSALMAEIANRSGAQHVILNLSVLATGGTAGFVLSNPHRGVVILVLPFVCSVLGALWLDHARCIVNIGTYIRIRRWPELCSLLPGGQISSYEEWAHEDRSSLWRTLLFSAPPMATFVTPGFAGLIYSIHGIRGLTLWSAWALGAVLMVASLTYWVVFTRDNASWMYVGPAFKAANP